jgi:hypothetical protein
MNKSSSSDDWLQAELADALDEDLELELSEPALSEEIRKIYKDSHPPTIDRAHTSSIFLRCRPSSSSCRTGSITPRHLLLLRRRIGKVIDHGCQCIWSNFHRAGERMIDGNDGQQSRKDQDR